MGRPPPAARAQLFAELKRVGLVAALGEALFPAINWHQSLSDRFEDDDGLIARLQNIGPRVAAAARAPRFRMDRVESEVGPDIHWAFKPERTRGDFKRLLEIVKAAVFTVDRRSQGEHSAHITVSYWAPHALRRMVQIEPVEWVMTELLLVRGCGAPYRYEVLGTWDLQPPAAEPTGWQTDLF